MTADTPSSQRTRRGPAPAQPDPRRGPAAPDLRERLLGAAELLVAEQGEHHLTVEAVSVATGTSLEEFHTVFADRTDCLLALFDELAERTGAGMLGAYRNEELWVDGIRASLLELLAQIDSNPRLSHLMIVGSAAGEPPLLARRARVLAELARTFDAERPAATTDCSAAPFGADAVIGAVAAVLHGRLQDNSEPHLIELSGSLMAMIVLPYLGVAAARAELARESAQ